jgi:HPt (histidine-containing phosphotransfer) domain-containing protein
VLGLFTEQTSLWGRLLNPEGDGEAWRDAAHTLKGSALGIGAKTVAEICGEAEQAWNQPPGVKAALKDRLDHAIDVALTDIAAWRHEALRQGLK